MTKASAEGFPERVASGRRDVPPPSVPGGLGQLTATGRGDQLRRTLSHFASGVTIVTALRESIPVGFTCQSFFSLSLDPPYVAIAPSKTSTTWPLIAEAGTFCVNILSEGQEALCRSFAVSGADKFAGVEWNRSPVTSSPLLVGSLAWVDCIVELVHSAGDHELVVGRVVDQQVQDGAPLIFYQSRFGGLAFDA